nr:variable surface lipoprotein [Mycoplasmopsis bovis]
MKKSKFLLLGSVASLASIPFVAAKCGETKEEKKPEADKPKLSETLKSLLEWFRKSTSCWTR